MGTRRLIHDGHGAVGEAYGGPTTDSEIRRAGSRKTTIEGFLSILGCSQGPDPRSKLCTHALMHLRERNDVSDRIGVVV